MVMVQLMALLQVQVLLPLLPTLILVVLTTITRAGASCTGIAATCANGGTISSMELTTNPYLMTLLRNNTVSYLLNLASSALGGTLPANVSYADISNAVDIINNSFDEGRFFLGYFATQQSCTLQLSHHYQVRQ